MNNPNELTITIVGVVTVFAVFVILYGVFKLMEIIGISQNKKVKMPKETQQSSKPNIEKAVVVKNSAESVPVTNMTQGIETEEEIAAVFAAIYSLLGENVIVKSIKPVQRIVEKKGKRGWNEWRTYGWRGGNKW